MFLGHNGTIYVIIQTLMRSKIVFNTDTFILGYAGIVFM